MSDSRPPRRFHVWADVRPTETTIELPAEASDEECDEACREALDILISNGDTGWNEVTRKDETKP